jgi:hypothetical protein
MVILKYMLMRKTLFIIGFIFVWIFGYSQSAITNDTLRTLRSPCSQMITPEHLDPKDSQLVQHQNNIGPQPFNRRELDAQSTDSSAIEPKQK